MSLVFVPVTPQLLADWAGGAAMRPGLPGIAATDELCEAFGVTDAEEAERVALLVASVAGLTAHGVRLVAVVSATAEPRAGGDPDFGEVSLPATSYHSVSAIFADEPRAAVAAAAAVAGLPLAEAWEHPAVTALLSDVDLLWHGAGEWEALTAG
ncbi:MAG: hypothetical protein LWW77_12505 [Propionibacteriales bacterium]|nr:hypothetical protein [Propionibacteriales bacterium]